METMTGKLVRLRPMRESDYAFFASLRNDLRTQAWSQRLPPCRTPEVQKEAFEKEIRKPNAAEFSIETLDGMLVGYIGFHEGPPRLAATFGLSVAVEHWGKGYSHEAQELVLEYLFEERGLQVVRLHTTSWNQRGIAAARKLGFKECVHMRENIILDGKVYDNVIMDMLREEYFAFRGKKDRLTAV